MKSRHFLNSSSLSIDKEKFYGRQIRGNPSLAKKKNKAESSFGFSFIKFERVLPMNKRNFCFLSNFRSLTYVSGFRMTKLRKQKRLFWREERASKRARSETMNGFNLCSTKFIPTFEKAKATAQPQKPSGWFLIQSRRENVRIHTRTDGNKNKWKKRKEMQNNKQN